VPIDPTFLPDSPMLIVCPSCTTSYQVNGSSLGPAGRSVRCVRCRHVWFARDPETLAAIAQAHRSEVEALVGADATSATGYSDDDMAAATAFDELAEGEPDTFPQPANSAAEIPAEEQPAQAEDAPPVVAPVDVEPPPVMMDAPALVPIEQGIVRPPDSSQRLPKGEDIETVAARRESARSRSRRHTVLVAVSVAILAAVALDAALIGGRARVVKAAPQTASLYAAIGLPVNLRGLSFKNVTTNSETHDGVQVLALEGTIVNSSTRVVEVPRLRFSVRNKAGQEIYSWTALPARTILSPGESLPFRSRLASPPPETGDVLVRFFHRRDLAAGGQ
jgi:predicted Zn finger-like uncharacterized protein